MDALKNPRFVRRYQILVEMLERGDNVTVKVGAPHSARRNGVLLTVAVADSLTVEDDDAD